MNRTDYFYKSVYRKDYGPKKIKWFKPFVQPQEFKDPINEGFRHYLTLDDPNVQPPEEDGEGYVDKFKENFSKLGTIYFDKPLDKNAIFNNQITDGLVSEYQAKYCDIAKDNEYYREARKKKFTLADDAELPETTYTWGYREPNIRDRPLVIIPQNQLATNEKINEILKIKTGRSEYMLTIGKLGLFVLETQMHGKVRPTNQPPPSITP